MSSSQTNTPSHRRESGRGQARGPGRGHGRATTGTQLLLQDDDHESDDEQWTEGLCFTLASPQNDMPPSLMKDTVVVMKAHQVDQNWILLDSQSTVNLFSNPKYLSNIRHCGRSEGLRVFSNGGYQDTFLNGDLSRESELYGSTRIVWQISSLSQQSHLFVGNPS